MDDDEYYSLFTEYLKSSNYDYGYVDYLKPYIKNKIPFSLLDASQFCRIMNVIVDLTCKFEASISRIKGIPNIPESIINITSENFEPFNFKIGNKEYYCDNGLWNKEILLTPLNSVIFPYNCSSTSERTHNMKFTITLRFYPIQRGIYHLGRFIKHKGLCYSEGYCSEKFNSTAEENQAIKFEDIPIIKEALTKNIWKLNGENM